MTDEIKQHLNDVFTQLADESQNGLRDFIDIQTMAHTLFQHEAMRLGGILGKNHPQVQHLEKNTRNGLAIIRGLKEGSAISGIQVVETPSEGVVVHGRVTDTNGRGIPGLTVYGEDENGKIIKVFGQVETKMAGDYTLSLDAAAMAKLKNVDIYLAVAAVPGKVLHSEKKPLVLKPGNQLLVNIRIARNVLYSPGAVTAAVDISKLRGVGLVMAEKLRKAGIQDVQTLVATDESRLKQIVGSVNIVKLKAEAMRLLKDLEDNR